MAQSSNPSVDERVPSNDTLPAGGRFPPQTRYILGNEACERFSFYGIRTLLPIYVTGVLLKSKDQSVMIIHLFAFACYLMPLVGGWISDRFWGRYRTILWISLLYCLGHGVLALSELSVSVGYKTSCLYIGLMFIAIGSGGIKPCVSAFMGDQFKPNQAHLIDRAYAAFYWCINLGSLGSFLVIPAIRDKHGYALAFGVPGILMGVATFLFWLGRRQYVIKPPSMALATDARQPSFFRVITYALLCKGRQPGDTFWAAARRRFSASSVNDVASTCRVLWVFLFVLPFFALFEQTSSSWVYQGKSMESITLFGYTFGAEQIQAANPAVVMLLIPLLSLFVYPALGGAATLLRRMGVGMFLMVLPFIVVGFFQLHIEQNGPGTLSLLWQIFPYFLLTASEVLVSATGLQFAFTQAPKTMKSTVTGLWLFTSALGNLLVVVVTYAGSLFVGAGEADSVSSSRFFFYAGLMALTAVAFTIAAVFYKYRQEDPPSPIDVPEKTKPCLDIKCDQLPAAFTNRRDNAQT
ncbi:MAG: POT family MFS transporter [Puniceicoccales bacterium]|jgi:POT family proton-dependent oligopeptide transporter|nr:POT family MFS transporter [Puniceicoccales bacterium]